MCADYEDRSSTFFVHVSPESFISEDHPFWPIRTMADKALNCLPKKFDRLCSPRGRPWAKSQGKEASVDVNVSEYPSAAAHQLTWGEIYAMFESDGWFRLDAKAKAIHGVRIHEN